jgi:hypothetical protein
MAAVLFEVELSFEGVVDRLDDLAQRLEQVCSRAGWFIEPFPAADEPQVRSDTPTAAR